MSPRFFRVVSSEGFAYSILALAVWSGFLLVLYGIFRYFFPHCRVYGNSMLPSFHDHEELQARRIFFKNKFPYKKYLGRVFVYKVNDVDGFTKLVIKRLIKVDVSDKGPILWFEGDNKNESYDSRNYGYVGYRQVVAIVMRRED